MTPAPALSRLRSRARSRRLQHAVDSVPYWFHSVDLGNGVTTPGLKTPEQHALELEAMRLPRDLGGKTVLDVGSWDGFYAFEAERRGARRVVALDSYVWNADLRDWLDEERRSAFSEPCPGRRGFDLAREALSSNVEPVVMDVLDIAPSSLGKFDIVLFLGVLYHMRHPLLALERVAAVTNELMIVETQLNRVLGLDDHALWEFYESDELACDPTNWWVPNAGGLVAILRAAGFSRAELLGTAHLDPTADAALHPYRGFAHAYA